MLISLFHKLLSQHPTWPLKLKKFRKSI